MPEKNFTSYMKKEVSKLDHELKLLNKQFDKYISSKPVFTEVDKTKIRAKIRQQKFETRTSFPLLPRLLTFALFAIGFIYLGNFILNELSSSQHDAAAPTPTEQIRTVDEGEDAEQEPTEFKPPEVTEEYVVEDVNLQHLSKEEQFIYQEFTENLDDEGLKGLDPLTIAKLYFHAGMTGEYETEYELYIQDEDYVLWSKEEHIEIPEDHRKKEWDEISSNTNVTVTIWDDNRATLSWESNKEELIDADGDRFMYSFSLIKNSEGVWKVSFLPMQ